MLKIMPVEPAYYSREAISEFADQVRDYLHRVDSRFTQEPPVDVERAVAIMGGEVRYLPEKTLTDLDINEFEGAVTASQSAKGDFTDRKFLIILPDRVKETPRGRFTLAHEIGHLMLHYKWPDPVEWDAKQRELQNEAKRDGHSENSKHFLWRSGRNRLESEANFFAACLLMPSKYFEEAFRERYAMDGSNLQATLGTIAEHFKVSRSAAENRAKFLELIPW